jgi:hypothetical protein
MTFLASVPTTCNALHTSQPSYPSGNYLIDPDGPGGNAAFTVYCDMTHANGGWTKVTEYNDSLYTNLAQRNQIPYREVLIQEWDHTSTPVYVSQTVQVTCYNSAKYGFQTGYSGGFSCDTGYDVRIGGTGGSCYGSTNGCFGVYTGATTETSGGVGCSWSCTSGAVTIWGLGYACGGQCYCRNSPATTTAGCGNGGGWGNIRQWMYVR